MNWWWSDMYIVLLILLLPIFVLAELLKLNK
nr:MAG TPA: Flagellar biosynthetic protein FliP protein export, BIOSYNTHETIC PROTEIN.4A [Caudoviricetes sp.]